MALWFKRSMALCFSGFRFIWPYYFMFPNMVLWLYMVLGLYGSMASWFSKDAWISRSEFYQRWIIPSFPYLDMIYIILIISYFLMTKI